MSAAGKPLDGTGLAVVNQIIEDRLKAKQDKLTGTQGQVVGFNAQGQAVAQAVPSTGVTSFKGRTGAVTPQAGDYTATQVGARPSNWTPTAADVGAVPTTRKVNNKALSADISLTAADVGALASGGTAAAATKLATSRTIRTNLGSTSTDSFNGTANVTPGVTGTLGVANGGTGSTTAAGALANLGADSRYLKLSGGDMTGMLDMNGYALTGLPNPVSPTDAVSYQFMMNTIMNLVGVIQTDAILFSADGSSNLNMAITLNLKKVTTIGDIVVFSLSTSGNILNSPYGYNKVTIKYPNGFGNPGGAWSEYGYEGPKFIYETSSSATILLSPYSDGYSGNLNALFTSGNYNFSGNMIVKVK